MPGSEGTDRRDGSETEYRRLAVDGDEAPSPERVRRLLEEAAGDAPVGVALDEVAPGDAVDPAVHRGTGVEEFLFVLAGELRIETDDGSVGVGANEAVFVPRAAPTRPVAVGDEPCRYLTFGAP